MTQAATLYERIGGKAAIMATVGMFYDRIMNDELLAPFFTDLDISKQITKQVTFMTMAFGGPHEYTGKDLRTAHAPLLSRGLGEEHFAAMMGHLQGTLEAMSISADLIDEAMGIIGSMKADVLSQ